MKHLRHQSPPVLGVVVGSFAIGQWIAHGLRLRTDLSTLPATWQILDLDLLRHDLWRSLLVLHAQPPAFNLLVAGLLPLGTHVAWVWALLAMILLCGLAELLLLLDVPRPLSALLPAIYAIHPTFLVTSHWIFDTLPIQLALVFAALCLASYARSGSRWQVHAFCWLLAGPMFLRASYHPIWFLGTAGCVAWALPSSSRRALGFAAFGPIVAVGLLTLKNEAQVGSPMLSSWLGMNLARVWQAQLSPDERRAMARDPAGMAWAQGPFQPPNTYQPFGYFEARAQGPLAVSSPLKSGGQPNFNHLDYARLSRDMLTYDLAALRKYPERYSQGVMKGLRRYLTPAIPTTPACDIAALERYGLWVSGILFLCCELYLVYPFAILGALRMGWCDSDTAIRAVATLCGLTLVWSCATSCLLEFGENARMRCDVDPLLIVIVGLALARFRADFARASDILRGNRDA